MTYILNDMKSSCLLNEGIVTIGAKWLPVFVEGVKSPRAFVGSQNPLKIFGLTQLKSHCHVRIVISSLVT